MSLAAGRAPGQHVPGEVPPAPRVALGAAARQHDGVVRLERLGAQAAGAHRRLPDPAGQVPAELSSAPPPSSAALRSGFPQPSTDSRLDGEKGGGGSSLRWARLSPRWASAAARTVGTREGRRRRRQCLHSMTPELAGSSGWPRAVRLMQSAHRSPVRPRVHGAAGVPPVGLALSASWRQRQAADSRFTVPLLCLRTSVAMASRTPAGSRSIGGPNAVFRPGAYREQPQVAGGRSRSPPTVRPLASEAGGGGPDGPPPPKRSGAPTTAVHSGLRALLHAEKALGMP